MKRHESTKLTSIRSDSLPVMSAFRIVPSPYEKASKLEGQTQQDLTKTTNIDTSKSVSRSTKKQIRIATARAITPMRRPSPEEFTTEQQVPSQRRSDLMAPKTVGFWSLLPYFAATTVLTGLVWISQRAFRARQQRLVEEFGEVLVLYGTTPDTTREIVSEYKRKLGPGILRGGLFGSYLASLVAEKVVGPDMIQHASLVRRLLRIGDDKAVNVVNNTASNMKDAPSLLGKLLFVSERMLPPEKIAKLQLVSLFPYSPDTVADLQRNMLERCYRDLITQEIEANEAEEPPMAAAATLRLDPVDAKALYDGVILTRLRKQEAEAAEAAKVAAAAAEEASKPDLPELDSPARSGEPAKATVHAYQCSDCGYTLFPAAGREFKFYGDDFVCPACGAPKTKFVDINNTDE